MVKSPAASTGDMGSGPGLEDPTRCRATEPQRHSEGGRTAVPKACVPESPRSAPGEAGALKSLPITTRSRPRSPQVETACTQPQRPSVAKKKENEIFKK